MSKDMIDEITNALAKAGIEFEEIWIGTAESGIDNWQHLQCNVRFKEEGDEEQ